MTADGTTSDDFQALLRILIQVSGRVSIRPARLRKLVGKHFKSYNLCNGRRTQSEIAKIAKLDRGNFSRVIDRWEKSGIVFTLGSTIKRPLHLYPLSEKPDGEETDETP